MEYIYRSTAQELKNIFGRYLPDATQSDFYELDMVSAGVMRGPMARKCDMYFTIENKLMRFLQSSLTLYSVPKQVQTQITDRVLKMNLQAYAEQIIQKMVALAQAGIPLVPEE